MLFKLTGLLNLTDAEEKEETAQNSGSLTGLSQDDRRLLNDVKKVLEVHKTLSIDLFEQYTQIYEGSVKKVNFEMLQGNSQANDPHSAE